MTFILGFALGILATMGAALIVTSDIDKDNNQF
jgi:hypothetical protein